MKAPKNQVNNFAHYNYRSCEDILEAVKPLLKGLILTLSDKIRETPSGLTYVTAHAKLSDGKNEIETKASAGIDINKKGMDYSQSFGSSSSYARKYALNGLFLIDDTKDSDSTNNHQDKEEKVTTKAGVLTDSNIESAIKKDGGNALLAAIEKGDFTATYEQLKKLKK